MYFYTYNMLVMASNKYSPHFREHFKGDIIINHTRGTDNLWGSVTKTLGEGHSKVKYLRVEGDHFIHT